ncbi:hypothetical protein D3C80_1582600 [compost metagenome]
MNATAASRGDWRRSLMCASVLLSVSMGRSTLAKHSTRSGYCCLNAAETPMDSLAGSDRLPCGLGLLASVRVFQACSLNGGSSRRTSAKRPISGVGDQ